MVTDTPSKLTSFVHVVVRLLSPAVRTRLVFAILLQAHLTEELSTLLMLEWVSSYAKTDQTLEFIIWLIDELKLSTSRKGGHL